MKTEVKKLEKGQIEITIELSVDEYQPFLETAAKKISENTKIPGFRAGKAGLDVVIQKVGEGQVWQEALDPAIQKTFIEAIEKEKLVTVGSPQIDVIKLAPGNPITYKATVGLLPKIELGDLTKINVEKKPVEIKEDQVKKAMENLQKMRAKETLVDRKSKEGDKVEIDFETFLDKIPVDNGVNKKFPLVIGEKTFIPGFEDQVVGLAKDETKEFQLKFPKEYHQKNLAGRMVNFKVKMNAVYQLDVPKLDDEFAKNLGEFRTIKEVEDKLKENLEGEAKQKEDHKTEEEMIDKIIEKSKFDDVPDILVDAETKKMIDELEHSLSHQGLKFEDYLTHLKKTRDELMLDFVPQAIKRVKGALIMRKVAETKDIKVTEADIDQEIEKQKIMYAGNPEAEKQLNDLAYRGYMRNVLTARKVMDYIKSVIVQ